MWKRGWERQRERVCVCMYVCVCMCVRECVHVCNCMMVCMSCVHLEERVRKTQTERVCVFVHVCVCICRGGVYVLINLYNNLERSYFTERDRENI